MLRHILLVCSTLLLMFAITGCKNDSQTNSSSGAGNTATIIEGNWYKRYTGTIAGQPVVVNMYCYTVDSNTYAGGTYYYIGKSELLGISVKNDPLLKNELHIKEWITSNHNDETPDSLVNTWAITIDGPNATGKFTNGATKKMFDINLHEDYTNASQLKMVYYSKNATLKEPRWTAGANAEYTGIEVEGDGNEAINNLLLHALGDDSGNVKTLQSLPKFWVEKQLEHTTALLDEVGKDSLEEEPMDDYHNDLLVTPVYNDHNFLVVECMTSEYSGGAHSNHASNFVTIDRQEKKRIQLGDVLKVDSAMISGLLDIKARAVFHIQPNEKLDDNLLVAAVPATDNFIITDKGLTFCYSPYEIASYADGDVWLFIPYSQLKPLLLPAFTQRMGLKL